MIDNMKPNPIENPTTAKNVGGVITNPDRFRSHQHSNTATAVGIAVKNVAVATISI